MKALGRGIGAPPGLRSFAFRLPLQNQQLQQQPRCIELQTTAPDRRHWQFALLTPAPGHVAAVCVESRPASDGGSDGQQQELGDELRLLSFDAAECLLGSGAGEQRLEAAMLAQGRYP